LTEVGLARKLQSKLFRKIGSWSEKLVCARALFTTFFARARIIFLVRARAFPPDAQGDRRGQILRHSGDYSSLT
jgi:hypothetical protein